MKTVRVVLLALLLPWLELRPRAAEPVLPLRTNDVIAFIGGANMVALAQGGHLETLLTLHHPRHKLRFRSLAWEGDTVFAQPRDVNYPDLVTQLKQVGATVALLHFGQMEAFNGTTGLTNFGSAYGRLLDEVGRVTPRQILMGPFPRDLLPDCCDSAEVAFRYAESVRALAKRRSLPFADPFGDHVYFGKENNHWTTDRMALSEAGLALAAGLIFREVSGASSSVSLEAPMPLPSQLLAAIAEKNRLWNDYVRPSNWAFLAGDRTEQAFSRDYRDRNIRAFAQEMQQFLPLIADAEKQVDELAAKTAAEKEATR
jgi:hypothetical protein